MKIFASVLVTVLILSQVSFISSTDDVLARAARAVAMVNAYSVGSLTKCASVGNNAPFCGVNYPVPEYGKIDAKALDTVAQTVVNGIQNNPQLNASPACAHDIKILYCNLMFPRCDQQRDQIIFNTTNCVNSDEKCPQSIRDSIKKSHLCDYVPRGTFRLNECVKPPSYNYQTCPNAPSGVMIPKFLSTNPIFQDQQATTFKTYLKSQKVSDQCIQIALELECSATPFCSPNKTLLLTTATQRVCKNFYNCLPAQTQAALKSRFNCNIFPNEKTGAYVTLPLNQVYLAGADANRPSMMMVACIVLLATMIQILTIS